MIKILIKFLIYLFLFILRVYLLWQVGLYDFDSVKNYLIIKEIISGNFENLFYHGTPFFYLFYSIPAYIYSHYFFLECINIVIDLTGIGIFVYFLKKNTQLSDYQELIFILIIGTSFSLISSARYFSMEALSNLMFILVFIFYFKSLNFNQSFFSIIGQKTNKHLFYFYLSALFYGLFITTNYKAILWFPLFILVEVFQKNRKINFNCWFLAGVLAFLPILFCIGIGYFHSISLWKYPAIVYLVVFTSRPWQTDVTHIFLLDFSFYFQYLFCFENIFLILGSIWFSIIYRYKIFSGFRKVNVEYYLFMMCIGYFLGMNLLLKAPRGLSFIYPLFYSLAGIAVLKFYQSLQSHIYKGLIISLLLFSLIIQIYRCQTYIYAYSQTNYDKIADYLHQHKIKKVISSVSLNLIPFAQKYGIEVKSIFDEKEIPILQKQGFEYVILDDYYKVVNLLNFNELEKSPKLKSWSEPTLLAPMLHLEHCEFTGFSFNKAWQNQQKLQTIQNQIHLIKLP